MPCCKMLSMDHGRWWWFGVACSVFFPSSSLFLVAASTFQAHSYIQVLYCDNICGSFESIRRCQGGSPEILGFPLLSLVPSSSHALQSRTPIHRTRIRPYKSDKERHLHFYKLHMKTNELYESHLTSHLSPQPTIMQSIVHGTPAQNSRHPQGN